jgi:hypothetical protein
VNTDGTNPSGITQNLPAAHQPGSPQPSLPQPSLAPPSLAPPSLAELSLADRARHRRWERRARRQLLDAEEWMQTWIKHPDGGDRTVAETKADENEQRRQIGLETDMGSRKHHRVPRWQRFIPKLVLLFDSVLLLYFFAGITNVNWQSPLSMALAFAVTLAAMVTVLAYGFLAFTGHRMRAHKTHEGTVHLDELDGFTRTAFGLAIAIIGVLALLMYLRIHSEVLGALGAQAGASAVAIPLAVAVVSAVANYLVVLIHAVDGSDEVSRLERLATATRRHVRKAHRLRWQAAQQSDQ